MEIFEQNKKDLPNSTVVLVLGILSLVFCWYYGFVGLVLGIIGLALSRESQKLYEAQPEAYTESSFKNLKGGRLCAIIGVCISVVIFLFALVWIIIFGAALFCLLPCQ